MSRKSVSRKSNRSPVPPIEKSNPDEQRLDLNNILQINPWKDVDKYDKQEVGQIQEILVQFNNMVIEEKKNKRRSVRKSPTPTVDTEAPTGNETLDEVSGKKEMIKDNKKRHCESESSTSITVEKNMMTDKTSSLRKSNEKVVKDAEEHPEEKKKKSKNYIELSVPLDDKKNKRKSVEKRRASTSSSKVTNNADLEVEMTKNKMMKSDKRKSCISESNIDIPKNVSTENTINNHNIKVKPVEEHEDHPEEKKKKSSKSKNHIELSVPFDDKNHKRKSVEKRRTSTSSSKATNNADLEVEMTKNKMMKSDKRKSCITESSIGILKNLSIQNRRDNQNIERQIVEEEDEDHPEETTQNSFNPICPFELDAQLNKKINKRKSQRRASTSSSKVTLSKADLEEKTKKKDKMRNDAILLWITESSVNDAIINSPENVATENSTNNQGDVDEKRKAMREKNKDLFFKVINEGEQSSVEKLLISSSAMKTIAGNNATEGQSTFIKEKFQYSLITSDEAASIIDPEENIDSDHKRDNIIPESYEEVIIATHKREKTRGDTINESVTEKIVDVYETFTVQLPERFSFISSASKNDESSYVDVIEVKKDESSCHDDFFYGESMICGHLAYHNFETFSSTKILDKREAESENGENSILQSDDYSTKQELTMKSQLVSTKRDTKNFTENIYKKTVSKNTLNPESDKTKVLSHEAKISSKRSSATRSKSDSKNCSKYNNNGFESKYTKKREEKVARAFEKFSKKFVKYSSKIEQPQNYKIGSNDAIVDSETDSYSSYSGTSSSSSFSNSDESSCSESTSLSSIFSCSSGSSSGSFYTSYSDSTSCSCPFCYSGSSSGSFYTSYSDSTSCSCLSCCEDDMYSEYTLASSSSTHPGSDDSTDFSTI